MLWAEPYSLGMDNRAAVSEADVTATVGKDAAARKLAQTTARCQAALAAADQNVRRAQTALATAKERLQRAQDIQNRSEGCRRSGTRAA
jgi:hypothetical protein